MNDFFVHINIKTQIQNKVLKKSEIYVSNNVYVQFASCNLLFLYRSLQHIKWWHIINNIVQNFNVYSFL
jgi:hypothetical protein